MTPYYCARAAQVPRVLRASKAKAQLAPAKYPKTDVWAFGETIPGTTLRIKQGETLSTRFQNDLPEGSSVHWHGIRIDNKMDGVPGMTQELVKPKASFDYEFVVPDAGTYWYHSHNRSWEQMAKGLYGPLIVEEHNPPKVDRDEVLVIDDWRLGDDAQISGNFGSMHDHSHGGRLGNWLAVNGVGMNEASLEVKAFERLRLRLINVANAHIFSLSLQGLKGWIVALDGQPLDAVQVLEDSITLAPAQRVDLIVDVTEKAGSAGQLSVNSRGKHVPIFRFPITGKQRESVMDQPMPLPTNGVSVVVNLDKAPITELIMEGGAMGRMRSATYKSKELTTRELVQQGMIWSFNGVAGMTDKPLLTAKQNETVRIRLVNNTAWPHGMHLHGHHFRQIHEDGKQGPLRDTILINRSEQMEIAFVADNPGDWLIHCHMLEHQASGMKTWIQVV
ncbi:MAG: multicopper oxidase family protein [Leucothrix sp.]